jgi:hypothetical protein
VISKGLRTLLLAQSSITDIVSQKIFVGAARQGTEQPYIVIDRMSGEKFKGLDGNQGTRRAEIDIECWHNTPGDATTLADVVSDFLDDYTGAAGSATIKESTQVDEADNYDQPKSGGEIGEWVTILNFEFIYTG